MSSQTDWTLVQPSEEGFYEFVELDCRKSIRAVRALRIPPILNFPARTLWCVHDGEDEQARDQGEEPAVRVKFIDRRNFRCWRGPIRVPSAY